MGEAAENRSGPDAPSGWTAGPGLTAEDRSRCSLLGTHREFMARGGRHAEMFALQADAYVEGLGSAGTSS